ncbi:MAG TPA: DUF4350 domain-containing protein [Cellvibrio sp.]
MIVLPNKKPEPGNVKIALLIAVLAIIMGGLGYWWYTTLVWEEKEIDLGYSKEALQNDFLAAEIFLRKHGVQATTVKNLSLLANHRWRNIELGTNDTLVLINANKTLDEERYDSLYEWVENGGTLITSTQNPFIGTHTNEDDLLLSDFGITPAEEDAKEAKDLLDTIADELDDGKDDKQDSDKKDKPNDKGETNTTVQKAVDNEAVSTEDKPKKTVKKDKKPENYYRCNLEEQPTEINFADETKPLRFDFSHEKPFTYHYSNTDSEAADESARAEESVEGESAGDGNTGEEDASAKANDSDDINATLDEENTGNESTRSEEVHLLFFDIGDGSVTITSDNYIWSNRRIDCHDHAYALWSLVNPNGRVWFLVNQDAPSLAAIIWEHAKYAVLAGVLALVLWLWTSGSRFGPVFTVPQEGRRSLAEHIYASAMLLWRKQQHPQLLGLLRAEIMEQLAQQMLPVENAQQQIEYLHTLTGLPHADIQQALFSSNLTHPQEFTRAIAHLQIIRKYL